MHEVKTQRFGELFVKNMLNVYFYTVIIKTYKVEKNSLTNFRKVWNKFTNSQPYLNPNPKSNTRDLSVSDYKFTRFS